MHTGGLLSQRDLASASRSKQFKFSQVSSALRMHVFDLALAVSGCVVYIRESLPCRVRRRLITVFTRESSYAFSAS